MDNVEDESVSCFICSQSFHALCYSFNNNGRKDYSTTNPCSKTFHDNIDKNAGMKQKGDLFGSFVFICDPCRTRHESHAARNTNDNVKMKMTDANDGWDIENVTQSRATV